METMLEEQVEYIMKLQLINSYIKNYNLAQIENIDKIIYNDYSHISSLFKEYLIYDDTKETLEQFYKIRSTKCLLNELIKNNQRNFISSTFRLCENRTIKKANLRKKKIRKIKNEDMKQHESESTVFRSTFISTLAKEDLSNSASQIPANSLEHSCSQDTDKIAELLSELDGENKTVKEWEGIQKKKGEKAKLALSKKITITNRKSGTISLLKQRKVDPKKQTEINKNQIPLNKKVLSCKSQARLKPQENSKNFSKPFSSNECYFGSTHNLNNIKKRHNENKYMHSVRSDIKEANIKSFSKIAIELSSELVKSLKKGLTINSCLNKSKNNNTRHGLVLSAELVTQNNQKQKKTKKNNYFAIYNKAKTNGVIKTPQGLVKSIGNEDKVKMKSKLILTDTSISGNSLQKLKGKIIMKPKIANRISFVNKTNRNEGSLIKKESAGQKIHVNKLTNYFSSRVKNN